MQTTIIWMKKSQVLVTVNFQYLLNIHIKGACIGVLIFREIISDSGL